MILFISAQGKTPEDRPSERFGRCLWFIRYDTETDRWQAFENPAASQGHGAGVAAAQLLIDNGCEAAVSGRFGPNAHQALFAAGIDLRTFKGEDRQVRGLIADWKAGKLPSAG
jgi:predicted Fe-Mo cluster-binding NifX family protein